jgi:hypothetical protein
MDTDDTKGVALYDQGACVPIVFLVVSACR